MDDENDDKFISLTKDRVNEVCEDCKEKCKQSYKVTVAYCPNQTNKKRRK